MRVTLFYGYHHTTITAEFDSISEAAQFGVDMNEHCDGWPESIEADGEVVWVNRGPFTGDLERLEEMIAESEPPTQGDAE